MDAAWLQKRSDIGQTVRDGPESLRTTPIVVSDGRQTGRMTVHAQDYIAAIVFGLVIGIIARILLPGRQNIGIVFTVLVGMGAAVAGTWLAGKYGWHSTHAFTVDNRHFDLLVVAVQVVIAIIGVGLVSMIVRGFTTDRRVERRR